MVKFHNFNQIPLLIPNDVKDDKVVDHTLIVDGSMHIYALFFNSLKRLTNINCGFIFVSLSEK